MGRMLKYFKSWDYEYGENRCQFAGNRISVQILNIEVVLVVQSELFGRNIGKQSRIVHSEAWLRCVCQDARRILWVRLSMQRMATRNDLISRLWRVGVPFWSNA